MIVEVEVSDIKELKKAIESERKEIIISDKKLIWLIKTLKSVKNVAFVTFLLVSAGFWGDKHRKTSLKLRVPSCEVDF